MMQNTLEGSSVGSIVTLEEMDSDPTIPDGELPETTLLNVY